MSAQAKLYSLFADKLFNVCLKYSRTPEDAQDTLQDSFMVIFKDIKKFKHKGSFEGWAKIVTVNVALQKFRKKSIIKFDDIEESKIPDEKVYVDVEEKEISLNFLLSLINKLPPQYQLIFNLYVLDKYTHKEISEILDISVGTSKSNLSRARKLLKKEIDAIKKLQL